MPNAVMRLLARILHGLSLELRATHADYRGGHAPPRAGSGGGHAREATRGAGPGVRPAAPPRRSRRSSDADHRSTKGGL